MHTGFTNTNSFLFSISLFILNYSSGSNSLLFILSIAFLLLVGIKSFLIFFFPSFFLFFAFISLMHRIYWTIYTFKATSSLIVYCLMKVAILYSTFSSHSYFNVLYYSFSISLYLSGL